MTPLRKISIAFGVLYLITYVTSIPALALYQPFLDDPVGYVASGGADNNQLVFAALLELLLIIANIGTAVVVYPLLKRQNHILSLSYVRPASSSAPSSWSASSRAHGCLAVERQRRPIRRHDRLYPGSAKGLDVPLGPGWVVGWGNGLILAT